MITGNAIYAKAIKAMAVVAHGIKAGATKLYEIIFVNFLDADGETFLDADGEEFMVKEKQKIEE